MSFGTRLSELRRREHMTQEYFSELLGVSRQSVSKWESDIAFPETEKIIAIAKLFGVTTDELLLEKESCRAQEAKAENRTDPEEQDPSASPASPRGWSFEYRSRRTFRGKPLVHIHFGGGFCRANGIIAIGNCASGVLAIGLLARGLVSFGIVSLGLLSFGSIALGLLSVAAIALGGIAIGAIAIGLFAIGALSLGLFSVGALACGVYGAAGDHAHGAVAIGCRAASGSRYAAVSHEANVYRFDYTAALEGLNAVVPTVWTPLKCLFLALLRAIV